MKLQRIYNHIQDTIKNLRDPYHDVRGDGRIVADLLEIISQELLTEIKNTNATP